MKLAFSSLACPSCHVDELIHMAKVYGYDGIELRTLENTTDLWELEDFYPENLSATNSKFKDAGISVIVVGTSISFGRPELKYRDNQFQVLRKFCEIARGLCCPYLRVFGGPVPEGQTYEDVLARDIYNYKTAVDIANTYNVKLLFETHDDFSTSNAILPLLKGIGKEAGIIWDILHPYRFGEPIEVTYKNLMPYINHVHIKDSFTYSKKGFDMALPGQGNIPIPLALSLLKNSGYNGYLCFEWEKHWHPEIAEAHISLPHFINYIKRMSQELF